MIFFLMREKFSWVLRMEIPEAPEVAVQCVIKIA